MVALEPEDASAIGYLGWALYLTHDYTRSLELSTQAFDMNPGEAWVLTNVGLALLALGRADEAGSHFRRRIELHGPADDFEEAIKDLKSFIEQHPEVEPGTT